MPNANARPLNAAQRAVAHKMDENTELLPAIIEAAHRAGWLVFHARPARTGRIDKRTGKEVWSTPQSGDAGYFDLTLMRQQGARIIFAELKSEKGGVSQEQGHWAAVACDVEDLTCHVIYHVWRPSDWLSGAVEEVLR